MNTDKIKRILPPPCHHGIFFAFFRHFLHLFFSLFIHFLLCFMQLFFMIFLKLIWPISLFNLILSYRSDKISHSFSYFPFGTHTWDQMNCKCIGTTTTGGLSTTRNRRRMSIYKSFGFLILKVLVGLGLSSCCLFSLPNPKSTLSLFLITWRFP